MLKRLLSNLRTGPPPATQSPGPSAAPPGDGAEGREAVRRWILWDRLPPLAIDELYADPARARAAELLALSSGEQQAAAILREQLAAADPHPVVRLLLAEVQLRQGNEAGARALLREIGGFSPMSRARAACINGQLDFNVGNFSAARHWTDIALAFAPHSVAVQMLNGTLLEAEGRLDEAALQFRWMLAERPDDFSARVNLCIVLQRQGRMAEGLLELETAHAMAAKDLAGLQVPRWDGRPLHAEPMLVTSNGGIGDILQSLRYAQLLRARAPQARIVFWTRAEIASVARLTGWFDEVRSDPALPLAQFDWQVSLLNLTLRHFLDRERPALTGPYIQAEPAQVERMRVLLDQCMPAQPPAAASARPLRVGLRWSGAPAPYDGRRSIPPEHLRPLFRIPRVSWIALLERGHQALAWLADESMPMADLSEHLSDLADTAALMQNLDLVISVNTSVAHLAGAIGKRTWLLSRVDADARWGASGEQSTLYDSVRVFRHPGRKDWDKVIGEVADALARLVDGQP